MRNLFTIIIFTCTFQLSNAQKLKDLYLNPDNNKFTLLTVDDDFFCQSKNMELHNLFEFEFLKKIKINQEQFITIKQYPTTLISDTSFLEQNKINNLDTLHCQIDSAISLYPITDLFLFYYNSHIIDVNTNNCYRLTLQEKFLGYDYTTNNIDCLKDYYILKSKGYNTNNNSFVQHEFNAIEKFYKFPYKSSNQEYKLLKRNSNSFLLLEHDVELYTASDSNQIRFKIIELDSNLEVIQTKYFSHSLIINNVYKSFNFDFEVINNKNYIIAKQNVNSTYYTDNLPNFVYEYDNNFNLLDSNSFNTKYAKDNYLNSRKGIHYFYTETDTSTIIKVTNSTNDTIRIINLPTKNKILVNSDSSFIILNTESVPFVGSDIFVYKWNKYGKFSKKISLYDMQAFYLFDELPTTKYDIDSLNNIMFAYSISTTDGSCNNHSRLTYNAFNIDAINYVSGKITNDINNNCIKDSAEISIKNILVELQLNGKKYYTLSDDSGKYNFTPYDTGHGKVILHLENQSTFINACQDTFDILISDTLSNPIINFLLHKLDCGHLMPRVSVDISTPFLRRCFDNSYTLTLTNESNDTAFNTYADIELDANLIPVDIAFSTAQNLGNNTYRFNFGTLNPLQNIRKNLTVKVNCDSTILGQTHCVKATSFPYEFCHIVDAKYMEAQASCRNDSVIFTVKNVGYPEIFQQAYRIIADDSLAHIGTLNFTQSLSTITLSYHNPTGKTYRLETRQYPIFIDEDTVLSVAIEGCGSYNFSTGFVTQFSQDDDAENVSIDCHQNVGSFDPNDKSAQPVGYGNSHLIENNQAIEYIIHFQNLGTYAASFITVVDTLSSDFDITTLNTITASHAYTVSIIDSNILQFKFSDINLIDAATDSLLSNGFIKFSIKPKANTSIGNEIKNNAFITFDYNEAIQTNTVQHEIGKDFLKSSIITLSKNNLYKDVSIKIYPNPTSKQFTVEITKEVPKNASLHIYSVAGNEIYVQKNLSLINKIEAENWSKGYYLFELKSENTTIQSGKIILQ